MPVKNKNTLNTDGSKPGLSRFDKFFRKLMYRIGESSYTSDEIRHTPDYEVRRKGLVKTAKRVGIVALTATTLFVGSRLSGDSHHTPKHSENETPVEYVVQDGDTAIQIVNEFGGSKQDVDDIQRQGSGKGHELMAGDKISVPPDMAPMVIKRDAEYVAPEPETSK